MGGYSILYQLGDILKEEVKSCLNTDINPDRIEYYELEGRKRLAMELSIKISELLKEDFK